MNISSISLKDFQCYYGEHDANYFEFGDGLNLVIADNGGGKSKFYDSFYWLIYDEVFNTDLREFISTSRYKEGLISDKKKKEATVGDVVTTEITMIASSVESKQYRITRIYKAMKVGDREWESSGVSTLLVDEKKTTRWESIPSSMHDSVLTRVIPGHLKPYMWFQGEQVDGLMDLKDKSKLLKVINLLSNIHIYDGLAEVIEKGFKKNNAELKKEQAKLIKNKELADKLNKEFDKIDNAIKCSKGELNEYKSNYEVSKDKLEELIGLVDDASKKQELKSKKEKIEARLELESSKLKSIYDSVHKYIFLKYWILLKSDKFLQEYSNKYSDYYKHHNNIIERSRNKEVLLPIDVPQPIHVENMLLKEKCFVCGRDAKKGTDEYGNISDLLNREKKVDSKSLFKNDEMKLFSRLYDNNLGFFHTIKGLKSSISEIFQDISDSKALIETLKNEHADINAQFEGLIEHDDSENIVKSFRIHEGNKEKYNSLIKDAEYKVNELVKRRTEVESQLASLVEGSVNISVKEAANTFEILLKAAMSTRSMVFDGLIKELETESNQLFNKMTSMNKSITGSIKLRKLSNGNYIPEIVDVDGHVISSSNDSNIILVKLALIMAILLSKGKRSENYTMILDAPTSKMAENYTGGFYSVLSTNFKQSIVATYDFLDKEAESIKSAFNVSNIYKVESVFTGDDRTDRSTLETKIVRMV